MKLKVQTRSGYYNYFCLLIFFSILSLSIASNASDAELEDSRYGEVEILAEDESDEEKSKKMLSGESPVEIDILPVDESIYSCQGKANGAQPFLQEPDNCLSFVLCANNTGYRIFCPKIPKQTYFNPIKGLCDFSPEDYCKKFVSLGESAEGVGGTEAGDSLVFDDLEDGDFEQKGYADDEDHAEVDDSHENGDDFQTLDNTSLEEDEEYQFEWHEEL